MIRLSSVRTSRGADDLLSIFAYILISSGLPCAISETAFMDDFLTEASRVTRMGYFLATLQATVELINGLFWVVAFFFRQPLAEFVLCLLRTGPENAAREGEHPHTAAAPFSVRWRLVPSRHSCVWNSFSTVRQSQLQHAVGTPQSVARHAG